jgi:uncharacterized protein
MSSEIILVSFFLFLLVALLYSAVGHAGASGYIAVMGLLNFAPELIKPTSLLLNIIVSAIAAFQFIKKGYFDKKIFSVFIFSSVPFAFLGGYLEIEVKYFKLLAGFFLLFSALMILLKPYLKQKEKPTGKFPLALGLFLGSLIGLVSGLIGVGGGIFLSPLLLMSGSTEVKTTSGIAAAFIFFNSISALAGHYHGLNHLNTQTFLWIMAVVFGGIAGSYLGSSKLKNQIILWCLVLVLLSAGVKFIVPVLF